MCHKKVRGCFKVKTNETNSSGTVAKEKIVNSIFLHIFFKTSALIRLQVKFDMFWFFLSTYLGFFHHILLNIFYIRNRFMRVIKFLENFEQFNTQS